MVVVNVLVTQQCVPVHSLRINYLVLTIFFNLFLGEECVSVTEVSFCPSSVKLSHVNGKFLVEFVTTHVGHDEEDFKNMRLSDECKLSVISQVNKGVKESEIINHTRQEYDLNQREHYLTSMTSETSNKVQI